jgi:hypothetical protein
MTHLILVLSDDIPRTAVAFSLHVFVRNKVLISQFSMCVFTHVKLNHSDLNDCHRMRREYYASGGNSSLSVLTVDNMAEVQHCEAGASLAI